ncbi:condensation domain-containing protein [Amycolatopsis sp. NPDC004378]
MRFSCLHPMIPRSHAQQRLWFPNRLEGPNATYNMPAVLRLTGALDRTALTAAPQDLLDRHELLRTLFVDQDDVPYQRILGTGDARLTVPVTEIAAADLAGVIHRPAARPFDLDTKVPIRAELFALSERDHVPATVIHHIAGDGRSMTPLARDIRHPRLPTRTRTPTTADPTPTPALRRHQPPRTRHPPRGRSGPAAVVGHRASAKRPLSL